MDINALDGYITTVEYANRLHVTRQAVCFWIKQGKLRAFRVSPRKWLIDPNELPEGAGFTS